MATSSVGGTGHGLEDERGRQRLVEILDEHGDEIARLWAEAAGPDVNQWPQFDRYLRALIRGLGDVFRGFGWARTQSVIDDLAKLRVGSGVGLEQSLQRALLEGRKMIRPLCPENPDECEELMLEALHECVIRFSESYQGLRLATESDRMHSRMIKSLITSLEARDPYTKGHSLSVAMLAQRIACELGPHVDPNRVYLAGVLHDVGKIGIPDDILLKPGALAQDEWEVMKSHPIVGATILKPIKLYADVVSAVLTHHENYNGTGYPFGIAGDDIPLIARILRVADTFDAMTTTRAHRPSSSAREAIAEIKNGSDTFYDPEVVKAFCEVIRQPEVVTEKSLATLHIDLGEFAL